MNPIKNRLKDMMLEHKISAPKLSEKSGLPLGSIKSILSGQSKNPRASTLEALASAFECEIADLLSDQNPISINSPASNDSSTADNLFKAAIEKVEELAKIKGFSLEGKDEIKSRCVMRVYRYALEKNNGNNPKIDNVYAEWVVRNEINQ